MKFAGNLFRSAARYAGDLVTAYILAPSAPEFLDAAPVSLASQELGTAELGT
jgi:hypothetical protein